MILLVLLAAAVIVRFVDELADTRHGRMNEGESMKHQINRIV